ncbi:ABC transporter ATP-binding protein [Nonomuraea jiangxiensis]|uniref:ABC-2 type transport system ATP-binding protein n=1 Tax=Nonomuraea jiangxiensis TaxID=633440 RepID=A0A1G9UGL9_9ACTN|nr:ABC transporter ATP-binding protein [Nonomuraea jiangxiensis]SDM59046.1 ABC-2 type transport system ATP-binding protein [Nonomuraea jiangxiensis]
MIEIEEITKKYQDKIAVDRLSFTVRPGVVTGFLGPNGAGKSTTMRMILGLDRPTSGRIRIDGRDYRDAASPLCKVGALLEAKAVHPGRSAYDHLRALAATHAIPASRIDEVVDLVGLSSAARRRAGGFSLGMSQRLGIAAALLGDPEIVMLDEPMNGLDPDGIRWIRDLLSDLAREGRTVFISSHLMNEMAVTAEHLVIIGKGRLIADTSMKELTARASGSRVRVRSPHAGQLVSLLSGPDVSMTYHNSDRELLVVAGLSAREIGERAFEARYVVHELTPVTASLEEAFMELTHGSLEYSTGQLLGDRSAA